MCLRISFLCALEYDPYICASGGMPKCENWKCENCHKHTTSSNSGQWLFTVAPDEVARCMSTRSNRWICNTCTIPPPNYPPPALVNLPDDQKEEDIVEEKDPPPPSHPPARTEVKCHKLNAVGWVSCGCPMRRLRESMPGLRLRRRLSMFRRMMTRKMIRRKTTWMEITMIRRLGIL